MNDRMRLLCAELRLQLLAIDRSIEQISADPIGLSAVAKDKAEAQLSCIAAQIAANSRGVAAAGVTVEAWVGFERRAPDLRHLAWQAGDAVHDLNQMADGAESYAIAVLDIAGAAVRECSRAVLEAVLARSEADSACLFPRGP
jgi:hypothetical protein